MAVPVPPTSSPNRRGIFLVIGAVAVVLVVIFLIVLAASNPSSLTNTITPSVQANALESQVAAALTSTQNTVLLGGIQTLTAQPSQTPLIITATIQPVAPASTNVLPTNMVAPTTVSSAPQVIVVTATTIPPTQASAIIATTQQPSASNSQLVTLSPGGPDFGQYATDVQLPDGYSQGDCGRVWQATNGQNLAWTAIFCRWQASQPAPSMKWIVPTKATISGSGTLSFELNRDLGASQKVPDPYGEANAAKSSLGLGWFIRGSGGYACVNGNCKELAAGHTFQLGFPQDMKGHYAIAFTLQSGNVEFWQGEKQNPTDDWPIPS